MRVVDFGKFNKQQMLDLLLSMAPDKWKLGNSITEPEYSRNRSGVKICLCTDDTTGTGYADLEVNVHVFTGRRIGNAVLKVAGSGSRPDGEFLVHGGIANELFDKIRSHRMQEDGVEETLSLPVRPSVV